MSTKSDKEFYQRMQGMLYAYDIAQKKGVEALEADIRRRNVLKAPFSVKTEEMQKFYETVSNVAYINVATLMLYTLHDTFGFGKQRLNKAMEEFKKNESAIDDLDYMGQHYVRLDDYAKELNTKYDLGLDLDMLKAAMDACDEADERTKYCKIDSVLEALEQEGYKEACAFLKSKLRY